MLTITLKRLIYLARTIKRPTNKQFIQPKKQTIDKQLKDNTQQKGFSHFISPTLKKVQKRYNDAVARKDKQQQQIMKSFQTLKNDLATQNQKKKKSAEDKRKQRQNEWQNLELPKDIKQKLKQAQTKLSIDQQTLLNDKQKPSHDKRKLPHDKQKVPHDIQKNIFQQGQISGRGIKSQQQLLAIRELLTKQPHKKSVQNLKQQVLLSHILSTTKTAQAKLNLSKQWKQQLQQLNKQKRNQQQLLNEKLRYQKLKEFTQNDRLLNKDNKKGRKTKDDQNKEQKRMEQIKAKIKIQPTDHQLWRTQYAPELIQQAINYKNTQLKYFKDLIQKDRRDQWDFQREKEMLVPSKQFKKYKNQRRQLFERDQQKRLNTYIAQTTITQQKGLTKVTDQQFYRQKGLKQYKQTQITDEYSKKLKQQGQKDNILASKLSDIFIDDVLDPQQSRLQKKQIYQKSSFGKYQTKLKDMAQRINNLGFQFDIKDLENLNKKELFADKNIREENQGYQQYLLKKQKKKKMDLQLKRIHKEKLRDDINFDYQMDPVKLEKLNPLEMEQGIKKIEQMKQQRQSTIISNDFLKQKIHFTKTLKTMSQFITVYFYNQFQNANNTISQKVQVGNILPNAKNTVLNIFWTFKPSYLKTMHKHHFTQYEILRQKKILQQKLTKQSPYISGKMTQLLGLRYGPDIRFYFNQILEQTKVAQEEIKKYKDQIVQLSIQEYKQKGLIKTPQQEQQYRNKLLSIADSNLDDLNNQKKLVNKFYLRKKRLKLKIDIRKKLLDKKKNPQNKSKQNQQYKNLKKKQTQKQKDTKVLDEVIGKKVQAKKQSIFSTQIQDQQLYFGKKIDRRLQPEQVEKKKQKRFKDDNRPVNRLWDQINKL